MATQTPGIQQLLAAEKRAADIVSEARKSKIIFYLIYIIYRIFYKKILQRTNPTFKKG